MKIGVAGTGAVGGFYGGHLSKAGNDVVFLARGCHLETMQENGLTVETETGSFTSTGTFTDDLNAFHDVNLVLFTVKSTDTLEMAQKLASVLPDEALILTLQNGVDNEEILSGIFGNSRVVAGAAYIQVHLKEPGTVKQIGLEPRLVIGAVGSGGQQAAEHICAVFNEAGAVAYPTDHIMEVKWKKLLWNVTFNPLSALAEAKVGEILDDEGLSGTAEAICREVISVARAAGIRIDEDFYKKIFEQGRLARGHSTSMMQDKLKGKPMELESICGYAVKKGRESNTATPVLAAVYSVLKHMDARPAKQAIKEAEVPREV